MNHHLMNLTNQVYQMNMGLPMNLALPDQPDQYLEHPDLEHPDPEQHPVTQLRIHQGLYQSHPDHQMITITIGSNGAN